MIFSALTGVSLYLLPTGFSLTTLLSVLPVWCYWGTADVSRNRQSHRVRTPTIVQTLDLTPVNHPGGHVIVPRGRRGVNMLALSSRWYRNPQAAAAGVTSMRFTRNNSVDRPGGDLVAAVLDETHLPQLYRQAEAIQRTSGARFVTVDTPAHRYTFDMGIDTPWPPERLTNIVPRQDVPFMQWNMEQWFPDQPHYRNPMGHPTQAWINPLGVYTAVPFNHPDDLPWINDMCDYATLQTLQLRGPPSQTFEYDGPVPGRTVTIAVRADPIRPSTSSAIPVPPSVPVSPPNVEPEVTEPEEAVVLPPDQPSGLYLDVAEPIIRGPVVQGTIVVPRASQASSSSVVGPVVQGTVIAVPPVSQSSQSSGFESARSSESNP